MTIPSFSPAPNRFRTKGLGYRGHMEFVERNVSGGVKAQEEAFGDPKLVEFFRQPFVAGGWYDVFPLAYAGVVCAELRGQSFSQLLRDRGRDQVERDLTGVYGFLARFASQRMVARAVVDALRRYFEFVDVMTEQPSDQQVRAHVRGVPEVLGDWLGTLAIAYTEASLTHVGTSGIDVQARRVGGIAVRDGVRMVELVVDVRWDA